MRDKRISFQFISILLVICMMLCLMVVPTNAAILHRSLIHPFCISLRLWRNFAHSPKLNIDLHFSRGSRSGSLFFCRRTNDPTPSTIRRSIPPPRARTDRAQRERSQGRACTRQANLDRRCEAAAKSQAQYYPKTSITFSEKYVIIQLKKRQA